MNIHIDLDITCTLLQLEALVKLASTLKSEGLEEIMVEEAMINENELIVHLDEDDPPVFIKRDGTLVHSKFK